MSAIITTDINRVPNDCDCYPVVTIIWFNRVNMKKCTKCGEVSDNFSPNKKRSDGLQSWCRKCKVQHTIEYNRTKEGFIISLYQHQRYSSRKRGHEQPTFTVAELREWCFSQEKFHELYYKWKESGYKREFAPSCDRTDNSKGYSLDRLQLMTWKENRSNGHADMRAGKIIHGVHPQKSVEQRTLEGTLVKTYVSSCAAERETGIFQANISRVCRGGRNHAGGFKWNFVNEHPAN